VEYAVLGRTGVRVSRICLGTATFGVAPLAEDAPVIVHRAFDLGVNFFDTANSYGNQTRFDRPGAPPASERRSSEELLGVALKGHRHDVVIASKVMEQVGAGVNDGGFSGGGLSRSHIMQQVESTLRRLQTDYLDIYYAHHPDPLTPLDQTLRAFDDMVRQGKVRYAALSTYPAWQLTEALWVSERLGLHAPICLQIPYNLVSRTAEREILPACVRFGLGVTVFSPLAGGLLAGTAVAARPVSGAQRWGGRAFSLAELEAARRLDALAESWGQPPAQLALAWLLSRPGVTSAIIGPETVAELEVNAPAAAIHLSAEQLAELDAIGG
jgi:aryl-alcohol dehydrogenase-like predicted oxidoreductase